MRKKQSYIVVLLLFVCGVVHSQQKINWDDLTDVEFGEKYFEDIDEYLLFPTFGPEVKKLEGSFLEITGFMIPIEADQTVYILSQNPYSSCFFCGQAGPETIIELDLRQPPKKAYELDAIKTIQGILQLNDKDVEHCNYILTDAVVTP